MAARNNDFFPPKQPVRFLIGGVHFGHQNIGDEAILAGIVTVLRNIAPNCIITVLTDNPDGSTSNLLCVKTFRFRLYTTRKTGGYKRAFRLMSRMLENVLHAYAVFRHDIIICAGATILSDSPATVIRLSSFGLAANKRLIYFPGGMNSGNPNSTLEKLVFLSREFDLFLTRDPDSRQRLISAGCKKQQIICTIDPAFNVKGWEIEQKRALRYVPWLTGGLPVVAIGISNEPDCEQHNHPKQWAMIADFVIEKFGAHVLFLPSNTESGKDLVVMKKTHALMKYRKKAMIIEKELEPKVMIALIAHLELMISSRMHQLIFSAMATTPFIGISRCDKTDTFLSFFDMKAAASTQNCTLGRLRFTLEETWGQREEIKKHIAGVTKKLYARSLETELLVRNCLEKIYMMPVQKRPWSLRLRFLLKAFFMKLGKDTKKTPPPVAPSGDN
ncbi:MAG: polysaccharide pyruvyl transferase family protein [Candidatus Electrothrix aestuarii]|uniref:Polysaccharide pyruvyl transferase family protein n=1 Tax=Candidatus Electrothrix aestuarii TaxID=3062594 RepID=A0AAU8LTP3_9BACT|nr:polysaccharide pyruvyl transferase family protein [Candidatus Electrothrix aestuarii]